MKKFIICISLFLLFDRSFAKTAIETFVCDRTKQVREVILKNVGKTECSEVTVEDLKSITDLDLSHRNIRNLKAHDFAGLTQLQNLYLNNNKLRKLALQPFAGLTQLQYLYLNNNKLWKLPPQPFANLTQLGWLNLNHNELRKFPPGMFDGLKNLWWLNLNHNKFRKLPSQLFADLTFSRQFYSGHRVFIAFNDSTKCLQTFYEKPRPNFLQTGGK